MSQPDLVRKTKKGLGFARAVYVPRMVGFGLLSLPIAAALHQRGAPAWLYALDALFGFIWPHIAYQRSSRHEKPVPTEYQNLRADAVFCGFWAVAMGFTFGPTIMMLAVLLMDNAMVGGLRLLTESVAGLLAGGLLAAAVLLGVPLHLFTDDFVRLSCVPFLLIYPAMIGVLSFRNGLKVTREKRLLRQFNQLDTLSGVYSRAYWEQRLEEEFERCKRYQRTATLILLDIDHFKAINDNFGHIKGDDVIRGLGQVLREQVRAGDIPARLGGDEFSVLLPESSGAEAEAVVRRIQTALAECPFGAPAPGPRPTLSYGIAEISANAQTPDDWLHHADNALYEAKRNGRNAFKIYRCDPQSSPPACRTINSL